MVHYLYSRRLATPTARDQNNPVMGACASKQEASRAPPPSDSLGALRSEGYQNEEKLGEGAFGEVILVEHVDTRRFYACKRLKKESVNEASLESEVEILKVCRHPNIVFLREVIARDSIFLVLELAGGGSLMEKIQEEKGLPHSYAASVIIQTASALDYLHGRGIVHRDMKPENVLLLSRDARPMCKLCDFGLSKVLTQGDAAAACEAVMKSRVGSHFYASPELLMHESYDASIDLWGLGHICFACLTGTAAFDDSIDLYGDVIGAKADYQSHPAWVEAPKAVDLCKTLLCADPRARPKPDQVLEHPWLLAETGPGGDRRINLSLRYLGRVASLRDVCYRALETQLPPDVRSELEESFHALDSDAKGYLNASDVRRALKKRYEENTEPLRSSAAAGHARSRSSWASGEASDPISADAVEGPRPWITSSGSAQQSVDVPIVLRRLLQNALAESGVGAKHKKRRGNRDSSRAAHGARRVGVVTFSMFLESSLETNPALTRRLWNQTFSLLDSDGDGVVGDTDLKACLSKLGLNVAADAREALLSKVIGCSSKDLLKTVLKVQNLSA